MAYAIEISESIRRNLEKLGRRNKIAAIAISAKLHRIAQDPRRFKPLKSPMQGKWRVHIDSSFVLTYSIDEESKTVRILDYAHHDEVYK